MLRRTRLDSAAAVCQAPPMRGILFTIAILAAAGCASADKAALAGLIGKPRDVALATLGTPVHQHTDGPVTRYRWRVTYASLEPAGGRTAPSPPACEVFLSADAQGLITKAALRGDALACKRWQAPYALAEKIRNVPGI